MGFREWALPLAPEAYYEFNDSLADSSGNGHTLSTLTVSDNAAYGTLAANKYVAGQDPGSRAIYFDGATNYAGFKTAASAAMRIQDASTFVCVIKSLAIVAVPFYVTLANAIVSATDSLNPLIINYNSPTQQTWETTGATSGQVLNGWHRVVVRTSATLAEVIVDGATIRSATLSQPRTTGFVWASAILMLLANTGPTTIDELAYWPSVALTDTQLAPLWAAPTSDPTPAVAPQIPFLVSNDRYQVVACVNQATSTTTTHLRYWSANAPAWDSAIVGDTAIPAWHTFDELGRPAIGSLELPVIEFKKESQVTGISVEFEPLPAALTESVSTTSTFVGFYGRVECWGVDGYERTVSGLVTSGVLVSGDFAYASTVGAGGSDTWPNARTVNLPVRPNGRAKKARVIINGINCCKILQVDLLGDPQKDRNV